MRASRLISILLLLQSRGRMTAQELAGELEVSLRTIYRDMESLGAAGVPVYADRGPAGGFSLVDGYRTRLTGLTREEAASLFLAGLPGPAAELGLGTVLAAAELKVLAALPPELRAGAGRVRERFHLDTPGWFREAERPPFLTAVAGAVWDQRPIRVHYQRWRGEVERLLQPLGLVLKGSAWYLVARTSGQTRTYRVSRILELEVLEEQFDRPAAFDLAAYWDTWAQQFSSRLYRDEAVVRLSPHAFSTLLPKMFDPFVVRAAVESAGPPDLAGWRQVVLPIESIKHAERDLLRLGADAEVLAPSELRRRFGEVGNALVSIYRSRAMRCDDEYPEVLSVGSEPAG
ncbi:MAG: helix-turn-helix transcriptional regulator [Dehalococcoidia bacterium]